MSSEKIGTVTVRGGGRRFVPVVLLLTVPWGLTTSSGGTVVPTMGMTYVRNLYITT